MNKMPKTLDELHHMALAKVRGWPGCGDIENVTIDLDEDGEWTIAAQITRPHDPVAVNRATSEVRRELSAHYTLAPDT